VSDTELVARLIQSRLRPDFGAAARVVKEITAATPRQHPLGFVYWERPLPAGSLFRVHLWLGNGYERRDGLTRVHDHIYDLDSLVMFGAIRNSIFSVEPAPSEQRLVTVDRRSLGAELEFDGATVSAIEVSSDELRVGDLYSVPRGVFHVTSVVHPPALTLVTNSSGWGRPRVVTSGAGAPRGTARETPLVEWRSAYESIMAELDHQTRWDDEEGTPVAGSTDREHLAEP
jgi:hypothetical protein